MEKQSKKFQFDRVDYLGIAKVLGWTVATALVGLGLDMASVVEVSGTAVYWFPIINTALYAIRSWLKDNKPS